MVATTRSFGVRKVVAVTLLLAAIAAAVYERRADEPHSEEGLLARPADAAARAVASRSVRVDDPSFPNRVPSRDGSARLGDVLDRAKADEMRGQIRALLAAAGPAMVADDGGAAATRAPRPAATMPLLPRGEGGSSGGVDPAYIQARIHDDLFPLAKECYSNALAKNPKVGGTLAVSFRILGDPHVGGVVDDVTMTDASTLDDLELEECVKESMMSVSFDAPPDDGQVTVVYPIVFGPGDDDGG